MFDEICSIYGYATDNKGRYVDRETGECIQQMTIREFCLTDRWKPYVEKLRAMIAEYGMDAKDMPEYKETKKHLPGATPSGLFGLWEDDCESNGRRYRDVVSRRESHLVQYTGWLVIDIDWKDNRHLSNFDNIYFILRCRSEVALLMRSCSGTGLFGLVLLDAPPPVPEGVEPWEHITKHHKKRFASLLEDYARLGIVLDGQCGNVGRVRFASWDDPAHIYINNKVTPYCGFNSPKPVLIPLAEQRARQYASRQSGDNDKFWEDPVHLNRLVDLVCSYLIQNGIDITAGYDNWMKLALSLQYHPNGESLFYQLSACNAEYNSGTAAQKWRNVGRAKTVTLAYLLHQAKEHIPEHVYKDMKRQVCNEFK